MEEVAVIMVPLPCQSHLNQLLHLSTVISSYGLDVHYVGSATHNRQAKLRFPGQISQIQFHDLPTTAIIAIEPNPADKLPVHLWPATEAYINLGKPIFSFTETLSLKSRRIVLIYDRMMAKTIQDSMSIPNVDAYAFNCISACNLFFILWEAAGKPFPVSGGPKSLISMKEFIPEDVMKFIISNNVKERSGDIHNTFRLVENNYIDLIARKEISGGKKQFALRPVLISPKLNSENRHGCLNWLDKQASKSVIYICFGTTTSLSEEEAAEIANGLEKSKKKFVWVLRDADLANIYAGESRRIELPEGFEERVVEDGIVVRDWVQQTEILGHESVGGFMSHCGWNSCVESMAFGVPVAAWAMHSDQPLNAILVTEVLGMGLKVREWGRRGEIVKAEEVRIAVERLMEGDGMKENAERVKEGIRKAMADGGEFWTEMDAFVAHLRR